ncbi:OLC1v1015996C1 [Oldenlandia corymbosa var. corymbosa]|uniref:OLC1v1015996C1 n=1 Tax=Oldenlandia corymbosa var. corymbosa TaxID=529605 RepID=A0AAV1E5G5_OLDCO|nr:OLC1v1015996C1 [Oldenlandia corymbosa var. corymbosa]
MNISIHYIFFLCITILLSLFSLSLGQLRACRPYPPCSSWSNLCPPGFCGNKVEWPELIGMDGQKAKAIAQTENPAVTVFLVRSDAIITWDICCNRLRIFVDINGKVYDTPLVG